MTRFSMILLVVALLAGDAHSQALGVERRQDLGFGFHRDVIAMQNPPGFFESVGHFEFLFYRQRKLCQLNDCWVAPSGRSVVYQDGPSGNVFVFFRQGERIAQLTKKFPGLIVEFQWHEPEGFVRARVIPRASAHEPYGKWITFRIPQQT
jgi:hypothetical protein